ncbi:MAG: glycosyltransferase family 2 protein [Polyangiaceae bacterium]
MSLNKNSVGCVSVLIPAFNEEATLERVLRGVLEQAVVKEVVVVDDGSTDGTAAAAERMNDARIRLFRQDRNRGKTAAIERAVREATGEILIVQDADLEYDPSEIPLVVAPILEGHADVVYGSRFLVRRAARVVYFYHFVANQFLTTLSNVFTNLNMTDVETGYKAFRSEILKAIPLKSEGFGMEIEITASIAQVPLRVYEVPISYYGRTYDEGKKIGFRDGVAAFGYVLYFNLVERWSKERKQYRAQMEHFIDRRKRGEL